MNPLVIDTQWIFNILSSVSIAILSTIALGLYNKNKDLRDRRKDEHLKEDEALKDGMQCLLRSDLISDHDKYCLQGYKTQNDLQKWVKEFKAYQNLNGNGMVEEMNKNVHSLPFKETIINKKGDMNK